MSELIGRIAEGWADEARTAALEARRRHHPDRYWGPSKAEKRMQSAPVHVSGSHVFGEGPHVGEFQTFTPDGRHANVRLELDDDHPAVKAAKGDFPDMDSDHFEFIDQVPVHRIEAHGRNVPELGRQHANEVTARVQAQQRAEVVRQNQIRRESAGVPTAKSKAEKEARRRELNAGLRTTSIF